MAPAIAITGATGSIGGAVAQILSSNHDLRLLVRDATRAPALERSTVVGNSSYDNVDACTAALQGCTTLLMVSAAEHPERLKQHFALIAAAEAAHVQHIVYTSFYGASPDAEFRLARDHWSTEEHIRASKIPRWTMLRDNFYMEELVRFADDQGLIKGPAGNGKATPVSRRDVVRSAAAILAEPTPHANKTYNLTGGERISLIDAAAAMTKATQGRRSFEFRNEDYEEAIASREKEFDVPRWLVKAWVSTYTAIAQGEMDGISNHVEQLTGEKPTKFSTVLAEWAAEKPI